MDATQILKAFASASTQDVVSIVSRHESLQAELGVSLPTLKRTGVLCPVIQTEIVAQCHVSECSWHVTMSSCNNCALVHANTQGDDFTVKDVALLYRRPLNEVKSVVDKAVTYLQRTIRDGDEPTFVFVPLKGVCVCCESPIEENTLSIEECEYCSQKCASRLSPTNARAGYIPSGE